MTNGTREVKVMIAGSNPVKGWFHRWNEDGKAVVELTNGELVNMTEDEICFTRTPDGNQKVQVRTK